MPAGANGHRSFKIAEGEPLQPSFGEDLYNKVFGEDEESAQYRLQELKRSER